jgi:hypothetical protein
MCRWVYWNVIKIHVSACGATWCRVTGFSELLTNDAFCAPTHAHFTHDSRINLTSIPDVHNSIQSFVPDRLPQNACFMLVSWVPYSTLELLTFLWNVYWLSVDHTMLYTKRLNSSERFECAGTFSTELFSSVLQNVIKSFNLPCVVYGNNQ